MLKISLIIVSLLTVIVFPQEKYFIYFKDKGSENRTILNKSSLEYQAAFQNLSDRAKKRRMKTMGEEIITYDDLPIPQNYISKLNEFGIQIINELSWFNAVSALLDDKQIEALANLSFIKSVEPVKSLYYVNDRFEESNSLSPTNENLLKQTLQNDYNYGNSFKQLNISDVPYVLSKGFDGSGVIIGLLDTGFDWTKHESLKNRDVIAEYDFVFHDSVTANQEGDAFTQDDHGTFIFSLIGGFKDSVLISPAFNSAYILAKTEDVGSETHIEEDNYAEALIWMESLGVEITSSSLGYSTFDSGYSYTYSDMNGETAIVTRAANLAFERGVTVLTAAGNEGNDKWRYITAPADGFNTIAVGAVNELGDLAGFSSIGPTFDGRIKPEVVAYGVAGFGAIAGTVNGYGYSNGTSISAPLASGVCALLLSAHPYLNNYQLRSILLESSSNATDPNNYIGYGIVSAKNAIEFPNLRYEDNFIEINKSFLENNVDSLSVEIIYAYDDIIVPESQMNQLSEYNYSYQLPEINNGKEVSFYFLYKDNSGIKYRDPVSGEYKFNVGSYIVSLNIQDQTQTYEGQVSELFPNPFLPLIQGKTSFYYNANLNEKFIITIYDILGNQVFEYSAQTSRSMNKFEWNGYSSNGELLASGVYLAAIQIGDNSYYKKLVLIK